MASNVPAIIAWDQAYNRNGDSTLPRTVVNAIRTHANNHTLEAWVKAETLADYTGLQIRAVRAQIAANRKAGWLEVVRSGNSSGLANRYRLTYPKGVVDDTVPSPTKGVVDSTKGVVNDTVKGVVDDTPTTPSNYSVGTTERTTKGNGVVDDTLPAEPFGSGGIDLPANTTTESNGVVDDTLPAEPEGLEERREPRPWELMPTWDGMEPDQGAETIAPDGPWDPFADVPTA
ncbi:hypothetical protein LAUMK191_04104 [Mycobacterium attenuatum]|uniref:hypothetical protein n=1 Tax=Mycobacterium attenuatum TaxID=2341086 RepID=UPI000F0400EB|nr:hypothetical protein [Mycobacterium attenuatum]VBA57618.1 hypothetical protein LAUMK191_04104 [Mycobacterium attenuatum]